VDDRLPAGWAVLDVVAVDEMSRSPSGTSSPRCSPISACSRSAISAPRGVDPD